MKLNITGRVSIGGKRFAPGDKVEVKDEKARKILAMKPVRATEASPEAEAKAIKDAKDKELKVDEKTVEKA